MNEHRCVSCGDIIPQGREICWACEHGYTPDKKENCKEIINDTRVFKRTKNKISTEE